MATPKKPQEQAQDPERLYGQEILGWDVPEFRKYRRGRLWYAVAVLTGVGLLIYSVASANFPFALFIVMFSIMLYLTIAGEPKTLRFSITETGILLGGTFRSFREISRFWVIYEPPEVKSLYIDFKSSLRPRMVIDLGAMNPNEVRAVMAQFAREDLDEDTEPFTDFMGRILKI